MPTAPISCCAARLLQGNIAVLAAAVAAAVVVFTKVRRFMRGIVLPSRRNGTLPPKKSGAPGGRAAFVLGCRTKTGTASQTASVAVHAPHSARGTYHCPATNQSN